MKGAVDGEGKVVFDAPHFSKYVIVQKGNSKVNVTIEYYDDTQNSKPMIYASKKELSPGESISNYDIADNWKINWAAKSTTDGNFERISDLNEIKFVSDCTIKVYYTPKDETIAGSTKFYDYTVKAGARNGTYYSFNQLTMISHQTLLIIKNLLQARIRMIQTLIKIIRSIKSIRLV